MNATVFDLDGTLVRSAASLNAVVNRTLAQAGLSALPLEQTTPFIGHGIEPYVARCFAAAGRTLSGSSLDDAVCEFSAIYAERPADGATLYDHVEASLVALADAGEALAVCTNKAEALARAVIAALGLAPLMTVLIGGDTLPLRKPDAGVLVACAERLGVDLDSLIFVGDSEVDGATAAAAGVPFFLFSGGYRSEPVSAIPHTVLFDDFAALAGLVSDHRAGRATAPADIAVQA